MKQGTQFRNRCTLPYPPCPNSSIHQIQGATDSRPPLVCSIIGIILAKVQEGTWVLRGNDESLDGEGHHSPPQPLRTRCSPSMTKIKGCSRGVFGQLQPQPSKCVHQGSPLSHHPNNCGEGAQVWTYPLVR